MELKYLAAEPITNPALSDRLQAFSGIEFFQKLLPNLIGLIFVIGVIIFFFILVIGGIQWISSGGDKAAIEQARGKVVNALIGIVILFSAFAIVKLLESFFGTNILTLDIGNLIIR